ncbi:hypothetical protein DNI29_21660 [Hymenobacter sediminis]|uniref:hypothetical protein n=1 Tax=Hymenobacter sediminis TaxID=2218621 RepID=UPI000F4FFE57|nr:hypothetical protein [Hymenobacter sediminis]RPD44318.1 hypothetical protein DNI29_21660 [Hymenobacter sediminis]
MVTRRKSASTVLLDPALLEEEQSLRALEETVSIVFQEEGGAAVCAHCGELLAWHEEECNGIIVSQPKSNKQHAPVALLDNTMPDLTPVPYAFAVGQSVQPEPGAQVRTIIWRGQVKARHPALGLVYRLNVYRLNNGYWDCYYESELQAA